MFINFAPALFSVNLAFTLQMNITLIYLIIYINKFSKSPSPYSRFAWLKGALLFWTVSLYRQALVCNDTWCTYRCIFQGEVSGGHLLLKWQTTERVRLSHARATCQMWGGLEINSFYFPSSPAILQQMLFFNRRRMRQALYKNILSIAASHP